MLTLALDVDGVLLDSDRDGAGHWSRELRERFGIDPEQLSDTFFAPSWRDVVTGHQPIEPVLARALVDMGSTVDVETVLACWFEADYVPIEPSFDLARRVARSGKRVVLATDQEHRRASHLRQNIGGAIPLAHIFYSADVGYQKRDPRFFEHASAQLDLATSERSGVVFVDDRIANVDVARSCGWHAIHATGDTTWRDEVTKLFGVGEQG